jgi:hypothetical protein
MESPDWSLRRDEVKDTRRHGPFFACVVDGEVRVTVCFDEVATFDVGDQL